MEKLLNFFEGLVMFTLIAGGSVLCIFFWVFIIFGIYTLFTGGL